MILVSATFVAEPLETPLRWLLAQAGITEELGFAPYHQVFQQLLTPGSELALNATGISVLLIRFEDFIRESLDTSQAAEASQKIAEELGDALVQFSSKLTGGLIISVLPPSPVVPQGLRANLQQIAVTFLARASTLPGVFVLSESQIDAVAEEDRYDGARDRLAHIPFTETHFASLALALTRRVHALRVPAHKVLVLDCDNTLWRGVVGEDGVEGIAISPPFAALQEFALMHQARGILLCLASKNVEADVLAVFAQRPDMRLKLDHIVAHRVNWQSKAANLRSLAEELNLGLDAFVFLDDNPLECAQIRAELPQVVTIQLPPESGIDAVLPNIWTFDKLVTTAEDVARTQMYRENSARRALESSVSDISQFLEALALTIDIAPPDEEEWSRVSQLTQRTNQFNFSTRRRSVAELQALQAAGSHILRARVSDRFGDYGLVGVMIAQTEGSVLSIDTLLLSCRVLGRGVEHAMVKHLASIAANSGLNTVSLEFVRTARNEPAKAFADSIAASFAEAHANDTILYLIPTSAALGVAHRPGEDPDAVIAARIADEKKGASATPTVDRAGVSERYTRFACELTSGAAVRAALQAIPRRPRDLAGSAAAPHSATEEDLLAIWENVLSIDGIGVDDDYFAIGGTSLLSVQLFAEIADRFGVQLRLTTILEAPTVRSLAALLDASSAVTERSGLVCLRAGSRRKLFLVHDGLGETLLYLNLARRLPSDWAVYGIEPARRPGIPLAHDSIEAMADFYVGQIRQIQPTGPYSLGGMCAGGVIAYEMAARLLKLGEHVDFVAILDGATPQAPRREVRLANRRRLSRLSALVTSKTETPSGMLSNGLRLGAALLTKAGNFIQYQLARARQGISVRVRFAVLRRALAHDTEWPEFLPELSVAEIYSAAEARYAPPALADVNVLLVRASIGDNDDTPYKDIYVDDDFGWRRVAGRLELVDVQGGHASMLQETNIESLAAILVARLPSVMPPAAHALT